MNFIHKRCGNGVYLRVTIENLYAGFNYSISDKGIELVPISIFETDNSKVKVADFFYCPNCNTKPNYDNVLVYTHDTNSPEQLDQVSILEIKNIETDYKSYFVVSNKADIKELSKKYKGYELNIIMSNLNFTVEEKKGE